MPILEKLNWHKQTCAIICPEDVHQTKPDPEGVLKALNSINASIEDLFMLETMKEIYKLQKMLMLNLLLALMVIINLIL